MKRDSMLCTAPRDHAFAALVRRLHKAELEHLREHCNELAEQIDDLENRLRDAEDHAEYWREQALQLATQHLSDGDVIGLARDGTLHVLANAKVAS